MSQRGTNGAVAIDGCISVERAAKSQSLGAKILNPAAGVGRRYVRLLLVGGSVISVGPLFADGGGNGGIGGGIGN